MAVMIGVNGTYSTGTISIKLQLSLIVRTFLRIFRYAIISASVAVTVIQWCLSRYLQVVNIVQTPLSSIMLLLFISH